MHQMSDQLDWNKKDVTRNFGNKISHFLLIYKATLYITTGATPVAEEVEIVQQSGWHEAHQFKCCIQQFRGIKMPT